MTTGRSSEVEHSARDREAGDSNSPAPIRRCKPGEPGVSLLQVTAQRVGVMAGGRAAAVVAEWAIATHKLGHELGQGGDVTAAVREYAAYWRHSERTAWRQLARFREVFPEEESPARLAGLVLEVSDASERRLATVPALALG